MQKEPTIDEYIARGKLFPLEEELRIAKELLEDVTRRIKNQSKPRYRILDYEGIARGTWDDEGGVDEYLRKGREL